MKTKKLVKMVEGQETLRGMFDSWMRDVYVGPKDDDALEMAKIAFYCGATAVYGLIKSGVSIDDEIEAFRVSVASEIKRLEESGINGQV